MMIMMIDHTSKNEGGRGEKRNERTNKRRQDGWMDGWNSKETVNFCYCVRVKSS